MDPIVRIREYQRDRVNFVLENVDLAYDKPLLCTESSRLISLQICQLPSKGHDGRPTYYWSVLYISLRGHSYKHSSTSDWLGWNRGQHDCAPGWVHRASLGHGSVGQHELWWSNAVYKSAYAATLSISAICSYDLRTVTASKTVHIVQSFCLSMFNVTTLSQWRLPAISSKYSHILMKGRKKLAKNELDVPRTSELL